MSFGRNGGAGGRAVRIASPKLLQQSGPGGAVDRTIHATASTKGRIGGIRDRVDALPGDVAENELDPVGHG
jgi:hypothetical protein